MTGRGTGQQILNFAHQDECELIMLGTHGARGVDRLILGSVADKVLRGATQMVLVVPVGVEPAPEMRGEAAAVAHTGQEL